MTEIIKMPESRMKIRFHDCDPFNHLNNSRYLDYMMTARTDQLAEFYGFDIYRIAREQGVGWVTAQTQINYLSPALLVEEVIVQTQLLSFGDKTLLFEATMWDINKRHLKSVMWTKLVHYNLATQKSQVHSEKFMQFLSSVVNPLAPEIDFEQRVKHLRQSI